MVQLFLIFKDNNVFFAKFLRIEQNVFVDELTDSVIEVMSRRNYIILKIKVQNMNDTIVVLCSNYDFQGPTAYHDQEVITQLSMT